MKRALCIALIGAVWGLGAVIIHGWASAEEVKTAKTVAKTAGEKKTPAAKEEAKTKDDEESKQPSRPVAGGVLRPGSRRPNCSASPTPSGRSSPPFSSSG